MDQPSIAAGWLTLRPFAVTDISWVFEVSQDAAIQHFVSVPSPYQVDDAAFFVEQAAIEGWRSQRRAEFLVADSVSRRRLGRVGLGLDGTGMAEIGYWMDPAARRQGVATHSVLALCQWAFRDLGVEIITWRTEAGNLASRRVAEKAGFLIEATLRKRLIHRGQRVDIWVGSLLSGELPPLHP